MEAGKKKGGRKPIREEENREYKTVKVRFNQLEYKQLNDRKLLTAAKDMSSFIRAICLKKPLLMKPQSTTLESQLLTLVRETRSDILRIGVNVNQATKHINSTTDYHKLQHQTAQLADRIAELEAICRKVMGQLSARETGEEVTYGSENQQRE